MRVELKHIVEAITVLKRVDALLYGDSTDVLRQEVSARDRVSLALDARWAYRDLARCLGSEMLEVVKATEGLELTL